MQNYRLLRAVKNRFGATDELGMFEMTEQGLISVENASGALLSGRPLQVSGSVVTACMEGTRPLLVEIQALMNESAYGSPLRMAQGIDRNRLSMLLAVLEKKLSIGVGNLDAYINVVGGIRITETAADLAILAAVLSSVKRQADLVGNHYLRRSRSDRRNPFCHPTGTQGDGSQPVGVQTFYPAGRQSTPDGADQTA